MATKQQDCCRTFAESYVLSALPAMRRIEQSVLGCDYGGTSWTTDTQALQMIDALALDPGTRLLDIGSGSGWPALYVAARSGCTATLVDMPLNALQQALARATIDALGERIDAVAASGASLPFRDATFDAVTHSDVLCCLPEKPEMFAECRRVIRDGGRSAYSVISIADGLAGDEHLRAVDAGPPFVEAPRGYVDLAESSGWYIVEHADVTNVYRESLQTLVAAFESDPELRAALGPEQINESRQRRLDQIRAIDDGLLLREIFVAVAA